MLIIAAWIAYQRTQASISAYGVVERGFFGGTYGLAILFSTWSSVLGVYLTTRWWGVPMHFLTSGLCAAMFFVVLVRLGVLTEPATVRHPTLSATVMTTALGLSMGVIWELFEWFGHTFIDDEMLVGYEDSLGDLVAGGPGSLLAGLGVRYLMARPCAASRPRMEA